ncbi:MAG: NUDIX domain-containing protein [Pseudomonadales bacterium]|nr:NUDIX domain-containing protein [Pseudomonadales bacterium]
MSDAPHITVACVIPREGRFLLVREKSAGQIVYNQPAGHLEPGESLISAAERETREETGWQVEIARFLGIYQYTAPNNGISYVRHCFVANPIAEIENAELDLDILDSCWLSLEEIETLESQLRSPLVLKVIQDFMTGNSYPLSLLHPENRLIQ